MSHEALERLERLRQLNSDKEWVNDDLYRLMYKEDLYIAAYERIKSEPGNVTPGPEGETLDGFSLEAIRQIIGEMRTEAFQFKPVHLRYIPKESGEMRKIGIPSPRDKIVQEIMRMILEAIYDSPCGPYFSDHSHGFRPHRSCHTALREFRGKWSATNWIVEGDIQSCFDDIDHGILVELLRKKIKDERFLSLVWKLLRAGYLDLEGERRDSLAGTPQGGIVSPILANIYLHELDEFIEGLRKKYEKGDKKHLDKEYRRLQYRKLALAEKGETQSQEFRTLLKRLRETPAMQVDDPDFIRIKYLRYADDWILGICGPRSLAEELKAEIEEFLATRLRLTLSEEKTRIIHARKDEVLFLGTLLTIGRGGEAQTVLTTNGSGKTFERRTTGWETVMKVPVERLVKRLHQRGLCDAKGNPISKGGWTQLDVDQIVALYRGINRGIQNYYRFCDNFASLNRIQYILHLSLAKTLAHKLRIKTHQVFRRYGRNLTVVIPGRDGKKEREVKFYLNSDWTTRRWEFQTDNERIDLVQMAVRMRTRSKLGFPCVLCGSNDQIVMHHVRHLRKMDAKARNGFVSVMRALNRKQLPVCRECHQKIHCGEYDGIKLSDLVYDPR
jgi:group II intron reverse transcriptase/maturase